MNPTEFWTLALCICGAAQCFFLAVCFGISTAKKSWTQIFPALLMLFLGVRILKSVVYLLEGEEMSLWFMNLGFAAHLAAAPALYLYLLLSYGKKRITPLVMFSHFIPSLAILFLSPWLKLDNFWYIGGYNSLLILSIIYWTMSLRIYLVNIYSNEKKLRFSHDWFPSLLMGTGVFFLAYFANYILGVITYAAAPFIYSLAIFPIGISAWRNFQSPLADSPKPIKKYQNLSLTEKDLIQGRQSILAVLEKEQAYLEPEFSLQDLSKRTNIPPHLLSNILNQHLNTNFTRLVNGYRIEAACQLLRSQEKSHYTIAAIAYEVGFSSLSVFNNHFKKLKGTTPSVYRKESTIGK